VFKRNERIVCKDGFEMSVQANASAYCTPRIDNADRYSEVEVGFPNQIEPLLAQYCDDWRQAGGHHDALNDIYAYVPASKISLICAKHGGIVSGELPAGIPYVKELRENIKKD